MPNDAETSQQLQEAYRLIRKGQQQEAVRMLVPMVRAQPRNVDAWWLLANALENHDQKIKALQEVLKLRPDHEPAQKLYDRIVAPPASVQASEAMPPDDFDLDADDPFAEPEQPPRVRVRRSRGTSPVTIILALIGLLTVASCAACLAVVVIGAPGITKVVNDIVQTVTFEPSFATLANLAVTSPAPQAMPGDMQKRGALRLGETKQAILDDFRDDSWTFSADASQHVIIELYSNDVALDPHLYLYDPNGRQIAENDDIDGQNNRNSRLDLTLPTSGLYTIRVGQFNGGGAYALSVREG
jgi:predicted transcriptional regulator